MRKEIVNQNQEAKRVPGRINPRRNTPRHRVIKPTKIKDRDKISKATRGKQQIAYKRTPSRLSTDFTIETLKTRKEWHDIFKVIKGKNPHHEYSSQQDSFTFDGEIKSFPDKQNLREFNITKPALQQMLEELLYAVNTKEGKDLQKISPKHQENHNKIIHYLKCKWIKCTN